MTEKTITCTECPMGCTVTVTLDADNNIISVFGNTCPRGKVYAVNEMTCPRRVVTSTVKCDNGKMLSVKTDGSVKKSEIFNVMGVINKITAKTPVRTGDILYRSISEEINLIATDDVE